MPIRRQLGPPHQYSADGAVILDLVPDPQLVDAVDEYD